MADVVKRVHYFDHQFLHVGDFETEQDYHRGMRHRHNRLLHTPGIAEGLEVSKITNLPTQVKVTAGTAFDKNGVELTRANDGNFDLASQLAVAPATSRDVYLVIGFDQKLSDPTTETGGPGQTRWTEDPALQPLANPPDAQSPNLLLAKVTLSQTAVTAVDPAGRRLPGAVGGDVAVSSLTLQAPGVESSKWVKIAGTGPNESTLTGSLVVARSSALSTDGNLMIGGSLGVGVAAAQQALSVGGGLNVDQTDANNGATASALTFGSGSGEGIGSKRTPGGNRFGLDLYTGSVSRLSITNSGNVGIGTSSPGQLLHVEGSEIHSGGGAAGFSFGDRDTTGVPSGLGERWVWYSQQKIARLWTAQAGDLLALTAAGNLGIGTTAPKERLDVVGGTLSVRRGWGNLVELWKTDATPNTGWIFHTSSPDTNRLYIGYSPDAGASVLWKYWLDPATDQARLNNAAVGVMGFPAEWAGFSHGDAAGPSSYGLLHHSDGKWTLINKRSGGGNIEFRVDNNTKFAMDDTGQIAADAGGLNDGTIDRARGAAAASVVFGGFGSGEGVASKRTPGGNQWGLDFYTAFQRRMWIQNNGQVFSVSGWNVSDRVLKKNVKVLGNTLDRVRQLEGVRFEWKRSTTRAAGLAANDLAASGAQIGLLADQVAEQFPELATQWEGDDGKSYYALDYGRVNAVLVEAIKELADRLDDLAARVDRLKDEERPVEG